MAYCCTNCFKDEQIINTIKNKNIIADCDFCSSKNVHVIDISKDNPVSEMIIRLVQSYAVSSNENAKLLKESLRDDWDIFNGGCEIIQTLVKALCSKSTDSADEIFTNRVIIPQIYDDDYQHEYGLFSGLSWNDFSDYIKYTNRFHNSYFNSDEFASTLSLLGKKYSTDNLFYRARICKTVEGYTKNDMFGPPKGQRCPGRIKPEEIGVLYLSSDEKTILYETRANVYDYISIGKFKAKRPLNLIDLSGFSGISPFKYDDDMIVKFAINRNVFHEMAIDIAKPVRRNDSPFEYLPTQFIAEFIKSQGYDGVAYESTISKGGYNFAIFDETLFECTNVETVEITNIEYSTNVK